MKTVILGDTHGRDIWKKIVEKEKPEKVIFIGDYFDSFNIDGNKQIENFKDIIQYKVDNPNTVLLIGNHDFHYMPEAQERYSGYQPGFQYYIAGLIDLHREHLTMAHREGNYLFTHAGVTQTWWNKWWNIVRIPTLNMDGIADYINDIFYYKPKAFRFEGNDSFGEDITQSPIWVRPHSLIQDAFPGVIQVVGHTRMKKGIQLDGEHNLAIFIDVLDNSNEYLIHEGNKMTIGKL